MPKYLITYHGGEGMPDDPEQRQQAIAAFGAWAQGVGAAMVDPGAPLGEARAVSAAGVTAAPPSEPIAGYTVLQTDSLDDALGLVKDHPFVARGGSLHVSETISP